MVDAARKRLFKAMDWLLSAEKKHPNYKENDFWLDGVRIMFGETQVGLYHFHEDYIVCFDHRVQNPQMYYYPGWDDVFNHFRKQ